MIKKRNLDNSLIQWVMTQTSLGPGIGKIKYVAAATSSTSQFRAMLEENGVPSGDIFTTLTAAEAACVTGRNDVIMVLPGAYDEAAEIDWDKSWLHLMGLSGPNTQGDYYEPNATIYTDTTEVVQVLDITGACCQFHNIGVQNAGANAANLAAIKVNKYGAYFKNCSFMGNLTSQQAADADCCAVIMYTDAHTAIFENCLIGIDCWNLRTGANSGELLVSGSQPNDVTFKGCQFRTMSNTNTCAMVACPSGVGSTQIGRGWTFDNCTFSNFSTNGTAMNQVFYGHVTAWHPVLLKDCACIGYDEWTDQNSVYIMGTMPAANDGGGIAIQVDDVIA